MPAYAKWMFGFGLFLVVSGFVGWAATGFASEAKTAILSGSVSGGAMIACGLLSARAGRLARAARRAGTVLPFVFGAAFVWRAAVAWSEVAAGEPKLYVAALLSAMTLGAVVTGLALVTQARAPSSSSAARVSP